MNETLRKCEHHEFRESKKIERKQKKSAEQSAVKCDREESMWELVETLSWLVIE